jgi:uncharacterized protein involved in exopolysaccharide biosynthesis
MDTLVRQDSAAAMPTLRGTPGAPPADPLGLPDAAAASTELGRHLRALVDARARIALFTAGATLATIVLALILPREWTARAVLLPSDDADGALPAQLSGLASSFGLQFPFGGAGQSDLYPDILTSERLLGGLLSTSFSWKEGAPPQPLVRILCPRDDDTYKTRRKAIRRLLEHVVTATKDAETGIVTLEITTKSPKLSADVANALVAALESYLIELRQEEGRKNRTFIDGRVADVTGELSRAEDRLAKFREANRRLGGSPELQLQEIRLQRDVMIQEQVFLELTKQKEIAEIEEVKNTPVLKVLDEAVPPTRASRPMRVLMVAAAFLLSAFGAASWVIARTSLRASPDLADALAPLAGDARRILRARPLRAKVEPS